MIGKKAAIGVIAATGIVAVGVPIGIVVGQHVAKKESLDSKMQQKWSGIESELAATFGGFDIRKAGQYSENKDGREANDADMKANKAIIDKVVGVNQSTAYFNSFTSIKQNLASKSQLIKTLYEDVLSRYSSEAFAVVNGAITKKQTSFEGHTYTVQVTATLNGTTGVMKTLGGQQANTMPVNYDLPYVVNLSIDNKTGKPKVVAKIEDQSFHSFIYGNAGENAFGKFDSLASDSIKPNNLAGLNVITDQMKGLLTQTATSNIRNSMQTFITGEVLAGATVENSLKNAFGLFDFTAKFGDFDSEINNLTTTKNAEVQKNLMTELAYLSFSLYGHHDKKTIDVAMTNWAANGDAGIPILDVTQVDKVFNAKGFKMPETNNIPVESVTVDNVNSENAKYYDLDTVRNSQELKASNDAIAAFNTANADLHTFTNEERFTWLKDQGQSRDVEHQRQNPGEIVEDVVTLYKQIREKYQNNKDFFDQSEFSLVWDQQKFDAVMNKYGISRDVANFEINITNDDGNTYTLSVLANGQIFVKSSTNQALVSQNPLFTKSATYENNIYYPLASPEWHNDEYKIAYSTIEKAVDMYKFATNAPFVLNQDSKITFGLTISNKENGKVYSNANGRTPIAFALNQKTGELFNNEGGNN